MLDGNGYDIFSPEKVSEIKDAARELYMVGQKLQELSKIINDHVDFPNLVEEIDEYANKIDVATEDLEEIRNIINDAVKYEKAHPELECECFEQMGKGA